MQPRRSVRQRHKALADDEKYAVLKGATPAKPEEAPSPDAEVLSDDDANKMFESLGLGRDLSPEREATNVISVTTPERPRPVRADATFSPAHGGIDATPRPANVVHVSTPVSLPPHMTPPAQRAVDAPIAIDFDADEDMIESIMSSYVAPSTYTPLIAHGSSPATITETQHVLLRSMGAPEEEIRRASTQQDVDDLFDKYANRPTPAQIEYLRKRGVSDAEVFAIRNRDTATVLISRMKAASPATPEQVRYIRRIYARDKITTPIPPDLREGEASRLITQLKTERPTTFRQRRWLEHHMPATAIPKLYAEADIAIKNIKMRQTMHAPVQ